MKKLAITLMALLGGSLVYAEETVTREINLPGASLYQERQYSTTEKHFNKTAESIRNRLDKGDNSARINPMGGPTVKVKTHASVGFSVKGIGPSRGKIHTNTESAAEKALRDRNK